MLSLTNSDGSKCSDRLHTLQRLNLCTQGILYVISATISSLNVELFLSLVGRSGIDDFQVQITGGLYGAIGIVVLLAAFNKDISGSATLCGMLAAFVTVAFELIYLPDWLSKGRVSALWIDVPYELIAASIGSVYLYKTRAISAGSSLQVKFCLNILFYSLCLAGFIGLAALVFAGIFYLRPS